MAGWQPGTPEILLKERERERRRRKMEGGRKKELGMTMVGKDGTIENVLHFLQIANVLFI